MSDDMVRRPGALTGLLRRPAGLVGLLLVVTVLALAALAPWIAPYNPLALSLRAKLQPPGALHWLGTDQTGRDMLSRVLWGARPSLAVGMLAVLIGLLGGCSLGLTAAYYGGLWGQAVMRAMDGLASIPLLIWAIAVVGIVGVGPLWIGPLAFPNEAKLIVLVGIFYMPPLARVTYGGALAEAASDYVRARRSQGASNAAIMLGDILPNCLSPVIVQATLLIAVGIVVEASLSFIGLGVEPPNPSWGSMLADARNYVFTGQWWMSVCPGMAISLSVIGFNLLGDALRDALDPRRSAAVGRVSGLVG
jgi:peptide/nickel transport system permease protein